MRSKGEYALLWANGKTFGEIYDLMEADILAVRASDPVHELSPEEYEDLAIAVATGVIDV